MSSRLDIKRRADRLGGTNGNELLTCADAVMLTVLPLAERVTIIRMRRLVAAHVRA